MLIKLSAEEEAMRHYSSSYSSSSPASHESGACNHRCPEHVSSISLCRGRTHLHHHHHVGAVVCCCLLFCGKGPPCWVMKESGVAAAATPSPLNHTCLLALAFAFAC